MNKEKDLTPQQINIVFGLFFIFFSLLIRAFGMHFISADYNLFLKPWYDQIKMAGGFSALSKQVGDYNIPYQIVIAVITYIPFHPLYCLKIFSVLFDYSLAIGTVFLVSHCRNELKVSCISSFYFAAAIMLPSVFLNSAYWGQCDVIYTSFIVWALYYLKKDRFMTAFIFLGLSFAFKLQVVFILPFVVYYCWSRRKIELLKLAIIPAVGFIMSLPAVFMGRPPYDFISIYVNQSDSYQYMSANAPNIWSIFPAFYHTMKIPSVLITFALLGIVMLAVFLKKIDLTLPEVYIGVAAWSAWTCIMFLPAMHERYFYIVDILLLLLALVIPRKYLILFIAEELVSILSTYLRCMLFIPIKLEIISVMNIMIYIIFSVLLAIHIVKLQRSRDTIATDN